MTLKSVILGLATAFAMTAAADAAVIGQATSVTNKVSGALGSNVTPLSTGSEVSGTEVVNTGAGSAALLQFLDATNLHIGASSTVVLDKFVYNPDGSAANAVINIGRGAMRFVTGNSDPKNFSIRTQVATIGIRGTDFVVACDGKGTCIVAVTKGVVSICPHPGSSLASCGDSYQIDTVNNFTLIGPDGTKGPQQIAGDVVLRLYQIIADGGTFDIASLTPNDTLLPLVEPATTHSTTPSPG